MLSNPNMNRRERRAAEAMERNRAEQAAAIPAARADKRPQYYDVPLGTEAQCYYCVKAGVIAVHRTGRVVQNDPANPPGDEPKGSMFTICTHHLPDDAVIYNPRSNLCRNKTGDHTWEEDARQEISEDLRNG